MINILEFREIVAGIKAKVNEVCENKIESCILAVKEEHLQKKIADKPGVILCANFPDAEMQREHTDRYSEDNVILLFLLEKRNAGEYTDEEEIIHYNKMQSIMQEIKKHIGESYFECKELTTGPKIRTEWEYNIYGGFNGLSIGFTLADYD